MYLHLSSSDGRVKGGDHPIYPSNDCFDFQIALPKTLHFADDEYEIALTEVNIPKRNRVPLYVCSDLCQPSYVLGTFLPVLRVVDTSAVFSTPHYMGLSRDLITSFRVYILNRSRTKPKLACEETRFTLHIRKTIKGTRHLPCEKERHHVSLPC